MGIEMQAQTVAIVHNIEEFTKEFAVASAVNDAEGRNPIAATLPNGIQKRAYKSWLMDGLTIPLISPEHLSYVSASSIEVYVNQTLYTDWQYNETTGILSMPNAGPDAVNNVAIYIRELNEVSLANSALQYVQNQWGSTAQAITFEQVPENTLCQHITYISEPKKGLTEALDFYAFAHHDVPKNSTSTSFNVNNFQVTGLTVFDNATGAVSPEDILRALKSVYSNGTISWNPDTGLTSMSNDVLTLWRPFESIETNTGDLFDKLQAMHNNYTDRSPINEQYLTGVLTALNSLSVYSNSNQNGKLLSSWQYWKEGESYASTTTIGMYVVGKTNSTNQLLGGTVDKGFPYFTVSSANIHVPDDNSSYNPIPTVSQYDTHQTVISIVGKSDTHLYVCIAPLSLKEKDSLAYERLCGFTRIRYTYTGHGSVTFIKTDVHQAWLGDAVYEIYKAKVSGNNLTNASLVQYYKYFDDIYYEDKEESIKNPMGTTITTSSTAAVKISLPYINSDEMYYFQEKTPPAGYLLNTEKIQFYLNSSQPTVVRSATDKKQNGVITWTVYDATTRSTTANPRVEVGLRGIPFTLIDESGQPAKQYNEKDEVIMTYDRIVTDSNGVITFKVRPGTYYVRQLDTIENYWMDIRPNEGIDMDDENCNYFKIVVVADRSGYDIPYSYSHYEKRQEVKIQSQVYDERIGNKTPPNLGGTGSGMVTTLGSEWELHVLGSQDLLVGYTIDGHPITINSRMGALNVESNYNTYATTSYAGSNSNVGTSPQLTYISATHIWINNVKYPLPNGTYCWKLKQASNGYVTTANRKTDLNAKWIDENKLNKYKIVMDANDESILSYVVMDRQQTNMTIYSKAYMKKAEAGAYNYLKVIPSYSAYKWDDTRNIYDTQNYLISTDSTHAQIQPASIEKITYSGDSNAEIYAKQFAQYTSTQTNGTANLITGLKPHAIYQLQNLTDIVSMDGGVIPANTILGRYVSDDDGYIFIDKFGSDIIVNPNVTSQDLNATFKSVGVIDTLGRGVNGTELPNGDYVLTVLMAPDEHEIEDMFEATPIYQTWTKADSVHDILTRVNVIPFYHARNTTRADGLANAGTYLAPSPVDETPEDPYDPRNPDNPAQSPNDSEDIPCPTDLNWIIKHRNDRTYRTIDRDNFSETQDIVPTTMAMAYTDTTDTDWQSTYALYMFYEITEEEYRNAEAAYLAAGFSPNQWERNWEYRRQSFGGDIIYFRRLSLTSTGVDGAATLLTQVMAFNTSDPDNSAWISYEELTRNKTMSAAVDNTSWLNMKMAAPEFQGAYHIAFGVLTIRETTNPLSYDDLRKEEFSDSLAILAIRNRQLFNLD